MTGEKPVVIRSMAFKDYVNVSIEIEVAPLEVGFLIPVILRFKILLAAAVSPRVNNEE